jgi:DsbC/DsbD-like thiol-disulfide interchange protein
MAIRFCLIAVMLAAAAPSAAQRPEDVVKWNAKAPEAAVQPGGTVKVQLSAKIEDGWVLYALVQPEGGPNPLDVAVAKDAAFTLDATRIDAPLPKNKKTDTGSENYYEAKVNLGVPLSAATTIKAGKHTVPVEVTFQVCSGSICLRPHTETLPIYVTVKK